MSRWPINQNYLYSIDYWELYLQYYVLVLVNINAVTFIHYEFIYLSILK